MAASAALLGKAGAGSDSKGGGRDGRRRRRKEIDRKVMLLCLKRKCRDEEHFNNLLHFVSVKERNKGGKRCKMMPIYEERVYNPWPLDKEEAVANLVQKRISNNRKEQLITIDEDIVIGSVDPGRMDIRLNVLFKQEQMVIDNEGTNKGMTTAEEAEDNICRAMMKEVSHIEEKIKHSE